MDVNTRMRGPRGDRSEARKAALGKNRGTTIHGIFVPPGTFVAPKNLVDIETEASIAVCATRFEPVEMPSISLAVSIGFTCDPQEV